MLKDRNDRVSIIAKQKVDDKSSTIGQHTESTQSGVCQLNLYKNNSSAICDRIRVLMVLPPCLTKN